MFTEQSFQALGPQVRDDSESSILINRKQGCPQKGRQARQAKGDERKGKGLGSLLLARGDSGKKGKHNLQAPSHSNSLETKALPVGLGLPLGAGGLGPGVSDCYVACCSALFSGQKGIMNTLLLFQLHVTTWKPLPSLTSPPQVRMN